MPRAAKSEVEAYDYIRRQLRELHWIVRNPSLGTGGQVWTQNQCFSHPEIKVALGLLRPENIVKLSERHLWVIEAKAERKQLAQAVDEATNLYSKPINDLKGGGIEAVLATGIAGDEEAGYIARTMIRINGRWRVVTINGQEATGLLSPDDVQALLDSGDSDIHEYAPPSGCSFRRPSGSTAFCTSAGSTRTIVRRRWRHSSCRSSTSRRT